MMKGGRLHRKVWLWWGRWWALQLYRERYVSLGIHLDVRRPYMDVHLGWLILSVGNFPVLTPEQDRHRNSCRGFLFVDDPRL